MFICHDPRERDTEVSELNSIFIRADHGQNNKVTLQTGFQELTVRTCVATGMRRHTCAGYENGGQNAPLGARLLCFGIMQYNQNYIDADGML